VTRNGLAAITATAYVYSPQL